MQSVLIKLGIVYYLIYVSLCVDYILVNIIDNLHRFILYRFNFRFFFTFIVNKKEFFNKLEQNRTHNLVIKFQFKNSFGIYFKKIQNITDHCLQKITVFSQDFHPILWIIAKALKFQKQSQYGSLILLLFASFLLFLYFTSHVITNVIHIQFLKIVSSNPYRRIVIN